MSGRWSNRPLKEVLTILRKRGSIFHWNRSQFSSRRESNVVLEEATRFLHLIYHWKSFQSFSGKGSNHDLEEILSFLWTRVQSSFRRNPYLSLEVAPIFLWKRVQSFSRRRSNGSLEEVRTCLWKRVHSPSV